MKTFEEISDLYDRHCVTGYSYTYGTAGFRHNADILDTVLFSTGVLACMRSIYLKGRFVGAMITASHNPPEDNGVKLVDPQGNMLEQDWEAYATDMANTASKGKDAFFKKVEQLMKELNIQESDIEASIAVARDSRESGPRLKNAFIDGTKVFQNVKLVDFGMLTTPQLHFLTQACNSGAVIEQIKEDIYYSHFVSAWEELSELHGIKSAPYPLVLDAANGIGGIKADLLFRETPFFRDAVTIINGQWSDHKLLNKACGADFVKTNQCLPENIPEDSPLETLYCSFDGDADRVIFYYRDASKWFHLLDGDKLSTLLAKFFQQLLPVAGIQHSVKLGVVQTAYANGSSAKYLSEVLRVPVSCTPTGVKHLHREAVNNYDIGIYFEANGHGTVVFSDNFKILVDSRLEKPNLDKDAVMALRTLKLFTRLINQTIGDAISDMMSVLFVLCVLKWSPQDWDREYRDLPNTLLKVVVPNRSIFKTTNAEQQLTSPEGLQDQIDEVVKSYDNARVFVRASGTEDAVRIYAEAATKDQANTLSRIISELVVNATVP